MNYFLSLIKNDTLNGNYFAYPNRIIYTLIKQKHKHTKYFKKDTFNLFDNYKPIFDDDISIFPMYNRLVENEFKYNKDTILKYLDTHYDIDMAMMWSIYADIGIFDYKVNDVNKVLKSYTYDSTQIRGITHCALVINWATQLNMQHKFVDLKKIEDIYVKYTLEYLNNNFVWTDTGMEAILTLILLNKHELIIKKWIKEIIIHQKKDGGWFYDEHASETHQHPSLLAIWILTYQLNSGLNKLETLSH